MRILVIGGTGQVGRHVVAELRALGADAVVASRHPGDGGLTLDLARPEAMAAALAGAGAFDAAYLTTPLGPEETHVGLGAVAALRAAGVAKIVYLGIHQLEPMRAIPHFATKIPIRDAVLADPRSVMLATNFFFQNDELFGDAMRRGGVYPLPVGGRGVWSIDCADIGRAAARALTMDDWNGEVVPLCGPEALTGDDLAAHWAAALGRPVRYAGDAIEPFVGMLSHVIPGWTPWLAEDFSAMMRVTQAMGCAASEADRAATRAIVGRAPRAHQDYVAEQVKGTMA